VTLSGGNQANYALNVAANTTLGANTTNTVSLAAFPLIISGDIYNNTIDPVLFSTQAQIAKLFTPMVLRFSTELALFAAVQSPLNNMMLDQEQNSLTFLLCSRIGNDKNLPFAYSLLPTLTLKTAETDVAER
jgi:hypothetical protein